MLKRKPDVECHAVPGLQTNLGTILHMGNKILTKKWEVQQGPLQILSSLTNYQTRYLTTNCKKKKKKEKKWKIKPSAANQCNLNLKQAKSMVYTFLIRFIWPNEVVELVYDVVFSALSETSASSHPSARIFIQTLHDIDPLPWLD